MNPNPGSKLSSRERTELEKYVRFLVFKMSQVIVQSRFGEKRKALFTSSKSFHDWFNLAIEDNAEIQVKAKEAYSNITPLKDFCMCTEILLKTADGDTLVLETWSLRMSTSDFFCDSPYVSYTSLASVYCRMTLLLKSVIAVTRITPAYKLSSRQSADTYVILFRIYPGEPQVHQLGEHYQRSKIGEVLTPVGTIKMSVSYRSKDDMTITPQKVEKGSPFMVKSDYFKPDMSPQKVPSGGIRIDKNLNCENSPNDLRKVGAFAPVNSLPDTNLFPELEMLEKPFLNQSRSKLRRPEIKPKDDDSNRNSDKNANLNVANYRKDGNGVDFNCNPNEKNSGKLIASDASGEESDDFVMKPPFANCDGDNDLGAFFRECQSAPPLASFASQPTLEEQVSDITSQLAKYEISMNDYDDFVDSMCQIDEK